MSILLETENGWIISHPKFFENVPVHRRSLGVNDGEPGTDEPDSIQFLKLDPTLFEITDRFKTKLSVNGKTVKDVGKVNFSEITSTVKKSFEAILKLPKAQEIFARLAASHNGMHKSDKIPPACNSGTRGNGKAVERSASFFNEVKNVKWPSFHGENPSHVSVMSTVPGCSDLEDLDVEQNGKRHKFIFPPKSRFFCKDVGEIGTIFREEAFDLIICDPPWRNKFIRRKKRKQHEAGYQLIDDDGISTLEIRNLIKENGVVAFWCTNAKSHQESLIKDFFPKWGVTYHGTFYWLKVTTSGMPIVPFNVENNKQPYEVIILGGRGGNNPFTCRAQQDAKLIISVPSSINSHKPPLIDVLKRVYPDENFERKCEIFARYLIPDFTSIGNEVIKLQHETLFVKQERDDSDLDYC